MSILPPTGSPHVEIDEITPVEPDLEDEQELATVIDHPGWKKIEQQLLTDIEKFKTGQFFEKNGSLEDIGKAYLIEVLVAERLENYLTQIREAVKAVDNARTTRK